MSAIELFSSDRWLVRAVNVDGEPWVNEFLASEVLKSYAGKGVSQRFAAQARPIIHVDNRHGRRPWQQTKNASAT